MSSNSKENSSGKKKYKKNALEYVDFSKEFIKDSKFKTELCSTFSEAGFCPYGNKCRFAHGRDELFERPVNHPNYRRNECNAFHSTGYCNYGLRCHFKHNENRGLDNTPRSYYTYLLKTCDDAEEIEVKKMKRLKVFQCITDKDNCECREYKVYNASNRYNEYSRIAEQLPIKSDCCNKSMSASKCLNFNLYDNCNVLNNLNPRKVVNYFELMNKLTKMVNVDLDVNSDLNLRNNNPVMAMNHNKSTPANRKLSVNSLGSPTTSSISSADSSTVAIKGKNSRKKSYSNYRDRVSNHAMM